MLSKLQYATDEAQNIRGPQFEFNKDDLIDFFKTVIHPNAFTEANKGNTSYRFSLLDCSSKCDGSNNWVCDLNRCWNRTNEHKWLKNFGNWLVQCDNQTATYFGQPNNFKKMLEFKENMLQKIFNFVDTQWKEFDSTVVGSIIFKSQYVVPSRHSREEEPRKSYEYYFYMDWTPTEDENVKRAREHLSTCRTNLLKAGEDMEKIEQESKRNRNK